MHAGCCTRCGTKAFFEHTSGSHLNLKWAQNHGQGAEGGTRSPILPRRAKRCTGASSDRAAIVCGRPPMELGLAVDERVDVAFGRCT